MTTEIYACKSINISINYEFRHVYIDQSGTIPKTAIDWTHRESLALINFVSCLPCRGCSKRNRTVWQLYNTQNCSASLSMEVCFMMPFQESLCYLFIYMVVIFFSIHSFMFAFAIHIRIHMLVQMHTQSTAIVLCKDKHFHIAK